jgi:hypothetical protein
MAASRPIPVWGGGNGDKIIAWMKVSLEDYPRMKAHHWWMSDGYACRTMYTDGGRKTTILAHRDVMGLKSGDVREVDHADRDRLNNTRGNLRIASRYQNEGNKPRDGFASQHVGVTFDPKRGKWKAQASFEGTYVYLGIWDTEEQAAAARRHFDEKYRKEDRAEFMHDPSEKPLT